MTCTPYVPKYMTQLCTKVSTKLSHGSIYLIRKEIGHKYIGTGSNLLYNSITVEPVQVQCHADSIQLQAVNPTIPAKFGKCYWNLCEICKKKKRDRKHTLLQCEHQQQLGQACYLLRI